MSATQGDIDVIITQQALKNIDEAAAKVEGLYVSFVNLVGAIENTKNLVDASNNVKTMASNTARLSIEVGKAKNIHTEFADVIFRQDEAYRKAGDALNKLDKEQLKAIQNAGSYSKASKLLIDNVAGEAKAVDNLSGAFKRLEADYKSALLYAKNVGAEFGITSKQFTKAAFDANLLSKEVKAMNAALGNHTGNVGNYAADIEKALSKTVIPAQKVSISIGDIWGGIRKLAYILPGIGIAGLFNVAGEAAYKLYEYITDVNTELTKSEAKFQSMNAALGSSEYSNAIVSVSRLREEIKLAKEGFINKTETLKSYNDTIGKTIGQANSLDEAESLIVKHGDAYIQMMLLKAEANEALNSAAKKAMEAEKTRLEG